MAEQGIAVFDPELGEFKKTVTLDLQDKWRFPRGSSVRASDATGDYWYFCEPFANVRVRAMWDDVLKPEKYESFAFDDAAGEYRWQRQFMPTSQSEEKKLIQTGKIATAAARYQLRDVDTGAEVEIHRGSINWNEYRQKWILIGNQANRAGKPSFLGEIWYAEAGAITGPWTTAVKVATHPKYSFYNPQQHRFMDAEGGKIIYFEGTYTQMFSGNPVMTPRYEYNQIMYRLDLSLAAEALRQHAPSKK